MRWVLWSLLVAAPLMGNGVDMRPKLSVKGEATLFAPADELRVTLGVISQEKSAASAINSNREVLNKILENLSLAGLDKKEWQTGRASIDPVFSRQEQGAYTPEITAYRVVNTINIKSEKLDKAGYFIDAAVKAGANTIENLQFGTKTARALRSEAITAASKNAVADARTLADATGQKLIRVLEVILDEDTFSPARNRNLPVMMAKMGDFMPLNPGDVPISATVTLIYEMAP